MAKTNIKDKHKRKHKRLSTQVLLNIEPLSDIRHQTSDRAVIQDISPGGARFSSEAEYNLEDFIGMKFVLPDHSAYFFVAIVKRIDQLTTMKSYGIRFSNMDLFDKLKLRKLIRKISIK